MKVPLSLAAAAGMALAVGVALAPAAQAGPVFTIRFNGEVAIGAWTTCPELVVGESCIDTTVFASDANTFETSDQETGPAHLRDRGDRLVLQRQWYTVRLVDGIPTGVPTRESFGSTADVDVTISHRLTFANVSAEAVPMHTTDYVAGTELDEFDSFSGDWAPAGELVRIDERVRIADRFLVFLEGTDGWSRSSAPTATVDGAPVPGTAWLHELVAVRQFSLTVLKGANSRP
jgi:hypothetical protein